MEDIYSYKDIFDYEIVGQLHGYLVKKLIVSTGS